MAALWQWKRFFWPELLTRPKARDAVREGAGTLAVLAFIYFVFTTASLWTEEGIAGLSERNYLDAFLLAAASFGVFCYSRVAAVTALVFFIAARLFAGFSGLGLAPTFIIFVALVNGVRGTFAYHRLTKELQMPTPPAPLT